MASGTSPSAFTAETKEAIYRRADGRCDRCGLRVINGMHFHHRKPRRLGGSVDPMTGLPSNGLLLHPSCHDFIESRRKVAAQLGFLLSHGSVPRDVPVYLWNGWHYLNDDGTVTRYRGVPPTHGVPPNPNAAGVEPPPSGDGTGHAPATAASGDAGG